MNFLKIFCIRERNVTKKKIASSIDKNRILKMALNKGRKKN